MTEVAKHKSSRSVSRLLGQYLDTAGAVQGAPIECRFAYLFLHTKRTKSAAGDPVDKPHFVVTVMVPKLSNDATKCANYGALAAHCMEAATKAWGSWPQGGKWPIQDGDIPYPQKLKPGQTALTPEQIAERNKWRTGHWLIDATNYLDEGPRVAIVQNGIEQPITSQTVAGQQLYKSGDHGYVFLGSWTFHNKTFGTNFGLEGVCFTRPGEKIGNAGQKSVQSMFGGVGAGVGAGMATATPLGPPAGAAPALPTGAAPMPPAAAPAAPLPPAAIAAPPLAPVAPMPPGLPPAPPAAPALAPFPTPGA
jgi:hypothetical protein